MQRWSVDRVTALAPDGSSCIAARKLATPGPWRDTGFSESLLWGQCQGSSKTPYQVSVDISGPTYECTCPSRKFPCKHVLALLFLWAEGRIEAGGALSPFAAAWASRRRPHDTGQTSPSEQTDDQRVAAAARAEQRERRVLTGLDELDDWLGEQIRTGLARLTVAEQATMAARLVDAQAPGLAARVRALDLTLLASPTHASRVVEEVAQIHLLSQGFRRQTTLDPDLRATVRSYVGFTTPRTEVEQTPPLRDRWVVVGMRDSDDEQVATRRVWLHGMRTDERALVLFFAVGGAAFDSTLVPEMSAEADLHFYPGRPRLRALVGARENDEYQVSGWRPREVSVSAALADYRSALAADPWLTSWPVAVRGVPTTGERGWLLCSDEGPSLAVRGTPDDVWKLLAFSGGHAATVFGELSADGLRPTSLLVDDRLVAL